MKELLERWSKLEPERIRNHGEDLAGVTRFSLIFQGHEFPISYADLHRLPVHRGALLAAVQEALKEHRWFWMLQRWDRENRKVYALVGWKASETGKANPKYANDWGKDEATTLLEVYVKALEAQ